MSAAEYSSTLLVSICVRLRLKRDGTHTETKFRLSPKRTSPFKSVGASVQSTTGSRGVRISGSNVGYTTFRGSVKSTGYTLHSPVSPSTSPPVRHRASSSVKRTLHTVTDNKARIEPCGFCSGRRMREYHIHSFSILSDGRSKASSKTMPPYSAIQSLLLQMRISSPVFKVIQ